MSKKVLEIENLTKYYGSVLGAQDINITLNEGEVFGFIGPNGAGKSTTIRAIMGLLNKTEGKVKFYGKELKSNDISSKEMIGYLPGEIHLYDDLKVKQLLNFHESYFKNNKNINKRRKELVKKLELDEERKIEDLSLGNYKKLGIVLALMHEPKLIILDEPTSGLDPIMQNVFYELILEEKKKGNTVFYSTHILNEISKVCDRVGIIKDGELLKIETVKELKEKNLSLVTIESKDIDKIIKDLKIQDDLMIKTKNSIKFKNHESIDNLIKILSKHKIDKMLIEEPTLDEIFLHYYK